MSPVVPTTAWMPCIASHGTVVRAASATVKSTTTSAPASAKALSSLATGTPSTRSPVAPGIDRGDELEIGIGGDGPAHRRAHPSPGPAHAHAHERELRVHHLARDGALVDARTEILAWPQTSRNRDAAMPEPMAPATMPMPTMISITQPT